MKYYHGAGRRGPYFEGWYLKCQTRDGRALALIPAVHQDRTGRRSASLQVLAEDGAWWLEYPESALQASGELFQIWLIIGILVIGPGFQFPGQGTVEF